MFGGPLPLTDLAELCRVLRHQLAAGVSLLKVLKQQSERGRPSLRPLLTRLASQLQNGTSLGDALGHETGTVPPLLLALVQVGEETGKLPETFAELESYFTQEATLRRQFLRQILPTAIQFCLAIVLIAGLIFILGLLAGNNGPPLLSVFGLGGAAGALAFLALVVGGFGSLWLFWSLLRRATRDRPAFEQFLLRVPVLGPCLNAIALSRLTLALQRTLDTGMPIARAVRLSLRATANAAFETQADTVTAVLKKRATLTEALEATGLFSRDFLEIVANGEEVGLVPEAMRHQAKFYREEASNRLRALTRAAASIVWLVYAGFMVWAIFRIAGVYLNALGA